MTLKETQEILSSLDNKHKSLTKAIETLENGLLPYEEKLKKLKEKYNVEKIQKEIKKFTYIANKTKVQKDIVAYRYLASVVYSYFSQLNTETKPKKVAFTNWLKEEFGVRYVSEQDYIDFCTFYKDYIVEDKEAEEDIDLEYDYSSNTVEVEADYWFRSELDDTVKFIVSLKTLENLEEFEKAICSYFENIKKEEEEKTKQKAMEQEEKEYQYYLKLQEKYGDIKKGEELYDN